MGTTACWGTNESFDCEWISFGYGSRQDTTMLWLSLEAYLALSRLDDLPMRNYFGDMTDEEFAAASPFRAYTFSSDHFPYTDLNKALDWFGQAREVRQYYEKYPEKVEEKARDEAIRKRVYEMYDIANCYTYAYREPYRGCFATEEDIEYIFSAKSREDWREKEIREKEENPLIVPGYDGKISTYDYINRLHETEEYKKRCIYTLGGIYYSRGWKDQYCQGPINWLGGEPEPQQVFADSNPNCRHNQHDPEMINTHYMDKRIACTEWEKMNNWNTK